MRRQREWTAICATQIHAPQNVSFAHTPGPQLSLPAHNSLGTAASILAAAANALQHPLVIVAWGERERAGGEAS